VLLSCILHPPGAAGVYTPEVVLAWGALLAKYGEAFALEKQ
jgi:hypothetical protein